jgi:hypothetical protein
MRGLLSFGGSSASRQPSGVSPPDSHHLPSWAALPNYTPSRADGFFRWAVCLGSQCLLCRALRTQVGHRATSKLCKHRKWPASFAHPRWLQNGQESRRRYHENQTGLVECDPQPSLFAPNNMAGQTQSIARQNQYELLGNADWADYFQSCPSERY